MVKHTRKSKQYHRKTKKVKGGRRNGNYTRMRVNDYTDCKHILQESIKFPCKLIKLKKPEVKKAGPKPPYKFYDCDVVEYNENEEVAYKCRSCDNKKYDGMRITKNMIDGSSIAYKKADVVNWCCGEE